MSVRGAIAENPPRVPPPVELFRVVVKKLRRDTLGTTVRLTDELPPLVTDCRGATRVKPLLRETGLGLDD